MDLSPEQITIAVTVYSRREYVLDAIRSALDQTVPVRVMVVEDCGPDPTLRELITSQFGARIRYFRNERNRGLFDNWNACMEYCATEWLSILHDDDLLRPNFVETMLGLAREAPNRALYFGRVSVLTEQSWEKAAPSATWGKPWREIDPVVLADGCFVMFPGQLFRVGSAKEAGGFRQRSYYTGDWDLWFRLALRFGAAQSEREVSSARAHYGIDRGSSRVERMGWKWALDNVQRKRNLRLLRAAQGIEIHFQRAKGLNLSPMPSRYLLRYAEGFSKRWLKYNAWIFVHSAPPHAGYALLQWAVRLLGPKVLRYASMLWNRRPRRSRKSRKGSLPAPNGRP